MLSTRGSDEGLSFPYNCVHMTNTSARRIAATVISTAVLAAPMLALAEDATTTSNGVNAQVQALLAQIKTLQEQIRQLVGSTTLPKLGMPPFIASSTMPFWGGGNATSTGARAYPCPMLARNLAQGSSGDDVESLQEHLRDTGYLATSSVTGFFGPLTMQAVKRYQDENGVGAATGFVGAMTREFFGKRCGEIEGRRIGQIGSTTA